MELIFVNLEICLYRGYQEIKNQPFSGVKYFNEKTWDHVLIANRPFL